MEHSTEGSFSYWVKHHKEAVTALWGSIGVNLLLYVAMRLDTVKNFLKEPWFLGVWFGIHLLVIVMLFALTYNVPRRESNKYAEPSKAVRDFYFFLLALWIVWAIFYSALTYRAFDTIKDRTNLLSAAHDVKIELTKANNTEAVALFLKSRGDINDAINLADKYPISQNGESKDFKSAVEHFQTTKKALESKSWSILINCLNNAQSAVILLLFWVLAFPRDIRQPFMIILVVIVGTTFTALLDLAFTGSMDLLGGLFAGVALALWVGRLDSKFLMTPPITIVALYFYSILQSMWFVFEKENEWVLVIAGLAMMLKVVIYLVCSWLLSSGRLLYFFQEMRLLYGLADEKEGDPMYGLVAVKDRLRAFLEDLRESDDNKKDLSAA